MTDPADRVVVVGTFRTDAAGDQDSRGLYSAGVLEVRGDFEQTVAGFSSALAFTPSGTVVEFAGTTPQTVSFQNSSPTTSYLRDVVVANASGVTFTTDVTVLGDVSFRDSGQLIGPALTVAGPLPAADPGFLIDQLFLLSATELDEGAVIPAISATIPDGETLSATGNFSARGDLTIAGTLDLAGFAANVDGDVLVTEGRLQMRGGAMTNTGNFEISGSGSSTVYMDGATIDTTDFTMILREVDPYGVHMLDSADRIVVRGDMYMLGSGQSTGTSSEENFVDGIIELHGNFEQRNSGFMSQTFQATGTVVEMVGGGPLQTILFEAPTVELSRFYGLTIRAGSNVQSTTDVAALGPVIVEAGASLNLIDIAVLSALPTVDPGATFSAGSITVVGSATSGGASYFDASLLVESGGTLILEGRDLEMTGSSRVVGTLDLNGLQYIATSLNAEGGSVDLAGGTMNLSGLLEVDEATSFRLSGGDATIGALRAIYDGDTWTGLVMTDPADELTVTGDAFFDQANFSTGSSEGSLTAGTIYFRADLEQRGATGASQLTFASTGTTVVFDGTGAQELYTGAFRVGWSRFDDLEIGVGSITTIAHDSYAAGDVSVLGSAVLSSGRTFDIDGTLTVGPGAVLDAVGTINASACSFDATATVTGAVNCP